MDYDIARFIGDCLLNERSRAIMDDLDPKHVDMKL